MTRFDPQALMALDIPETCQTYDARDVALYALGVGAGIDPLDPVGGRFATGLAALPAMTTVLGYRGLWIEQLPTGIDVRQVLHGEQGIRLFAPLPPRGAIRRKTRVTGVIDKGPGRGALVLTEDTITNAYDGLPLATLTSTIFCRAEGGRGGTGIAPRITHAIPQRVPDLRVDIVTSPQQALIYRLSGDDNPLHSDPGVARVAGFPAPVLHGLASCGTASRVMIERLCGGDETRFRAMDARFSAPAYPGETLDLHIWIEAPGHIAFRLLASEREARVIDNGRFEFAFTN